jgi:ABC-type multidrug transport system ATPase subunit
MHTAQHLVHKCLAGDLACGRTIILVTHHIAICLPSASYLVEIKEGTILHQGTIPELEERGLLLKVLEAEEEPFSDPQPLEQKTINEADNLPDGTGQPQKQQLSDGKLIEVEARAEGRVSLRSYVTYIRATGLLAWILTIILLLVSRAIQLGDQVSRSYLCYESYSL